MKTCQRSFNAGNEVVEDYYNTLQRYSTLYRILLSRAYSTETTFNQWNRIDLKLVNELGLTLTHLQKKNCWLEIDCHLLVEKNGHFFTCTEYQIACRPLQHDAWEFNSNSDIAGFHHDSEGDFEYMISNIDEAFVSDPQQHYYIQIFPTCKPQQIIQAFPLVIGPIAIEDQQTTVHHSNQWCDNRVLSQSIFHACCVQEHTFLVIKENWELGTPGKMWDSALVLSQMFSDKIKSDPTRFKNHRILDLSAGTGCVGLLMAKLYKEIYDENKEYLPQITMTDLPHALDLIYQNRATNHLEGYTEIQALTWGNYDDVKTLLLKGPIDIIIASDVLYEPSSFSKLVQTLDWLSAAVKNIDIFLGYKRRGLSREDEQSFFQICAEKFHINILPIQPDNKLITNEGWIVGGGFSNIFKETGVNIYQLVRK
ncbi:putative methyltransferase-domain-containing protein [Mucor mucedo]|uniref:putative methyltransferase-domain-containing protein n=1 Tax=Mucor mucedo TaxID=29922 RepID=UPI00221F4E99|nr:putative methyltransferase-domain-containing protein [Mucor mucedo]KAI7864952.1 putative methyltransferase-domain-containing protein [Mucor mucedo]